jgi:hypothetical protein
MKKKYLIEYRVISTRTKEVEADSIALAEEKLYEQEKDYIDEVLSVNPFEQVTVLKGE